MNALLKFGIAAAVTYFVVDALLKREGEVQEFTDAANPPSSVDDIPTLHAVNDALPQRPEPLSDEDLNVAQNSPL